MRYLISVPTLSMGSGLSQYVLILCKLLSSNNEVAVLTTHNDVEISYEQEELTKISPKIKLISLGTRNKYFRYLATIKEIVSFNPDVIINNYDGVIQYILPIVKGKRKIVHILHNDTDDFYRIGSINGRYVDGWIAPTQAIADHFKAYTDGKFSDRTTVISHGVNMAKYNPRCNKKLEIVYAGVLYEHKGVKILPDIVKRLRDNSIDFHLTIVGKGELRDWLHSQFEYEINSGMVTMTGVVAHDEVYKIMSKADIFLYPTHLDAFGLVIAEAMINGVVPVVTHLPGITDNLIEDKVNGFLLGRDDVESFASTIIELAHNAELRNTLSQKAFDKAISCFSTDTMKNNYLEYFQKLF